MRPLSRGLFIWGICAFLSSCASSNWTNGDSIRQGVIVALQVMDWQQTRKIASESIPESYTEHPDGSSARVYARPRFHETNPILGDHPSDGEVNLYFLGCLIGNAAVSYILPPKYRAAWQYTSMAVQGYFVVNNYRIGVRW